MGSGDEDAGSGDEDVGSGDEEVGGDDEDAGSGDGYWGSGIADCKGEPSTGEEGCTPAGYGTS